MVRGRGGPGPVRRRRADLGHAVAAGPRRPAAAARARVVDHGPGRPIAVRRRRAGDAGRPDRRAGGRPVHVLRPRRPQHLRPDLRQRPVLRVAADPPPDDRGRAAAAAGVGPGHAADRRHAGPPPEHVRHGGRRPAVPARLPAVRAAPRPPAGRGARSCCSCTSGSRSAPTTTACASTAPTWPWSGRRRWRRRSRSSSSRRGCRSTCGGTRRAWRRRCSPCSTTSPPPCRSMPAAPCVSGVDQGAWGAWRLAAARPDRFAAVEWVSTRPDFDPPGTDVPPARRPAGCSPRQRPGHCSAASPPPTPGPARDWRSVPLPATVKALDPLPAYTDRATLGWLAGPHPRPADAADRRLISPVLDRSAPAAAATIGPEWPPTSHRPPAVVLIHHFGGSRHTWAAVMAGLGPGCVCVAPDLRGFGGSAGRRGRRSPSRTTPTT